MVIYKNFKEHETQDKLKCTMSYEFLKVLYS